MARDDNVIAVSRRDHLDFATTLAYEAGRLTLGHFRNGVLPEMKDDDTPVTVADREAERLIRKRICERYPSHAILGEEYGSEGGADFSSRWVVDPIDGTLAFVHGVPLYAVLIALEVEGVCEVGAAYFPALDEMVYAATGEGCYCNGRRVRVSQTQRLSEGVVAFTDAKSFETYGRETEWERLRRAAGYARGWSDAYGHALVATGRAEAMFDPAMNPWDCGPFLPIMREAGGYFGDWSGEEGIYGGEALSTSRALLPEVLGLIRSY